MIQHWLPPIRIGSSWVKNQSQGVYYKKPPLWLGNSGSYRPNQRIFWVGCDAVGIQAKGKSGGFIA